VLTGPHVALRSILLACVASCCVAGCRSDDPLFHWEVIPEEPLQNAIILQQAEESHCVWSVVQDAATGRIAIHQSVPGEPKERRVHLQTGAGVLVGTDNGEWGGGLSLVDANGVETKRVLDKNVIQLLPSKSGVFIFTGLLHLGRDEGAAWLYSKGSDGIWLIKKIADLDGKPNAASTVNGGALAVGGHGVYVLDQSLNLTEIVLPFAQTRPNSISEDASGRIYVGMNAFVVRLTPTKTGYSHEWFTKSGCLR
jgi:hypothetical protein